MKVFNYIFFLLFFNSCVEDKPVQRVDRYQAALESCKNTVFIGDITAKNNFLSLMECLRWNEELPTLYSVIKNINEDNWNFITRPIDEEFFHKGASSQREKLFSFLYQSNSNGQLKKIDNYLGRMSIKNLSILFKLILSCDKNCNNQLYSSLIPSGAKSIEISDALLKFYTLANQDGMLDRVYNNKEIIFNDKSSHYFFTRSFNNFSDIIRHPIYMKFLSPSILGVTNGNKSDLRIFLDSFSSLKEYQAWFRDINSNSDNLINFMALISKSRGKVVCPGKFNVDLSPKLNSMLSQILEDSYSSFPSYLLNDFSLLTFGRQVCEEIGFENNIVVQTKYIKDGYKELENEILRSPIYLTDDVARIMQYQQVYTLFKKALAEGNYRGSLVNYFIDLAGNPLMQEVFAFADYLKIKNEPFYNDLAALPFYLTDDLIKIFNDGLKLVNENENVRNHFSFILSKFKQQEVKAFMEEFHKLLIAFENPESLLLFIADLASLGGGVLDRYKLAILEDKSSVDKLNEIYSYFIESSLKDNFESEFSLVLSSRYIIKAARLIGRGVIESNPNFANFFHGRKAEKIRDLNRGKRETKLALKPDAGFACLSKLTERENFIEVLSTVQKDCATMLNQDGLFSLLQDLGFGYTSYFEYCKNNLPVNSNDKCSSIFDKNGVAGENNLQQFLVTLKSYSSKSEESGRVILRNIFEYIKRLFDYRKGGIKEAIEDAVLLISSIFDVRKNGELRISNLVSALENLPTDGEEFRQKLLKLIAKIKLNITASKINDSSHREDFSCENYFIQPVGHNRCQSKSEIKKRVKRILHYLTRENGKGRPTALSLFTRALSPDVKYEINFYDEIVMYQLTFKETLEFLINVNNPNFIDNGILINQKKVKFHFINNGKKQSKYYILNSGDRLEAVVREVRFDGNYLGVHYMNSVASSPYYVETIKKKLKLLKTCGLYLRYCLRTFTKSEHAMLKNGINTYPSLWETESAFGHGKFIKTLLHVLVDSSSERAAKSATVKVGKFEMPYMQSKDELKEHNGRILTEVTYLASFSNLYRVLLRSFGSLENLVKYKDSAEFAYISNNIFKGVSADYYEKLLIDVINSLSEGQYKILDQIIDLIYDLPQEKMIKVESVIHDLIYLMAYLPDTSNAPKLKFLLNTVNNIVKDKKIISLILNQNNFSNILNFIHAPLRFLVSEIKNNEDELGNLLLVALINTLQEIDNNLLTNQENGIVGFLSNYLESERNVEKLEGTLEKLGIFVSLEPQGKELFLEGLDGLNSFLVKSDISFNKLYSRVLSQLYFSTMPEVCSENQCIENNHYDELFRILSYFGSADSMGKANIFYFFNYLSSDVLDRSTDEFGELIDAVEVLE